MPWPAGRPKPPTRTKLTPEQVVEIRIRYADGNESYRTIAAAYGVTCDTIYKIVNSYSWQLLPGTWDPELRTYLKPKEGRTP